LQTLGKDIEAIYVEGLDATLPREELLNILVLAIMEGAIDVDWRDFFPYLKWVPNKSFEHRIQHKHLRREAVMKALIADQRKRIDSGEVIFFLLLSRHLFPLHSHVWTWANYLTWRNLYTGTEQLYRLLVI